MATDAPEWVADASAVGKLFLDEPESDAFRDWWYDRLRGGDRMIAPPLLAAEIGSIVRRNLDHLDEAAQRRVWREALAGIHLDDAATADAFTHRALTFYDACYIALALARKAPLVTYDDAMRKAMGGAAGKATAPS